MSKVPDISDMLKNNSISFTNEELEKIIETELAKPEEERNNELIELCRNLSAKNDTESDTGKSKRKLSFRFVFLIITIFVFLFALIPVFSNYVNANETDVNTLTEKATLSDPTSEKISALVTDATTLTTSPETETETSSTTVPDVLINYLNKPEKIIFYHDGKPRTIAKGDVMCDEVIKRINKATKNEKWGILKLAVEEGYIDKIKNENLCIEIYYNDMQVLSGLKGHTQDKYNFERLLIVLDKNSHGLENTIFFFKNGKYQHGPIGAYSSNFSEEVLRDIFDEWITNP